MSGMIIVTLRRLGHALREFWADWIAPVVTEVSAHGTRLTSAESRISTLEQTVSGFGYDSSGYITYNYPETVEEGAENGE